MSEKAPMTYRRALPAEFLGLLAPGGPLRPLVELVIHGPDDHALDLHLRGSRVTLYLGLTKAFDLLFDRGRVRLKIHRGQPKGLFGPPQRELFKPQWERLQEPDELAAQWPQIRGFVDRVVAIAVEDGRFLREGLAHAALRRHPSLTLLDREWVLAFCDTPTKRETLRELQTPFAAAVTELARDHRWAASKKRAIESGKPAFGDEVDAMLVDDAGRLVVTEVKLQDAGGAGWTPAQSGFYAAIVRNWLDTDPAGARESLQNVLDQRAAIGLVPGGRTLGTVVDPIERIILVEGRRSNLATVTSRMRLVSDALTASGHRAAGLLAQRPDGTPVEF
jgi:hypothetical protein